MKSNTNFSVKQFRLTNAVFSIAQFQIETLLERKACENDGLIYSSRSGNSLTSADVRPLFTNSRQLDLPEQIWVIVKSMFLTKCDLLITYWCGLSIMHVLFYYAWIMMCLTIFFSVSNNFFLSQLYDIQLKQLYVLGDQIVNIFVACFHWVTISIHQSSFWLWLMVHVYFCCKCIEQSTVVWRTH